MRLLRSVLLLLWGCGRLGYEPEGALPEHGIWESGSRIRARVILGDDGSRQFVSWHDTELDVECSFRNAPDGMRCLPIAFRDSSYFADASCSPESRIAQDTSSCREGRPPVRYVGQAEVDGCSATETFFELGPEHTGPFYTMPAMGPCEPLAGTPSPSFRYYRTGPAVAPDAFVPAIVSDRGKRILQRVYLSADGAREAVTEYSSGDYYDAELAISCRFMTAEPERTRCLPAGPEIWFNLFADPACTVPTVNPEPSCEGLPPPPRYARNEIACGGNEMHTVASTTLEVFSTDGTSCQPGVPEVGQTYYVVGDAIAQDSFVEGVIASEDTPRRLQARFLAAERLWFTHFGFLDTSRGETCFFRPAADGGYRCLPAGPNHFGPFDRFSDAACTIPAASQSSCDGTLAAHFVAFADNCGRSARVYEFGAPVAEVYYRIGIDQQCTLYPVMGGWHEVGPEIPLDSFVAGTEIIE